MFWRGFNVFFDLQPAVDRQPGHRRGDREEVETQKDNF